MECDEKKKDTVKTNNYTGGEVGKYLHPEKRKKFEPEFLLESNVETDYDMMDR